jgi:hypothetical protein
VVQGARRVGLPESVPVLADLRERGGELAGGQVGQPDVAQVRDEELLNVAGVR